MHKAKNLVPAGAGQKPTATGEAVFGLQQAMPHAKLVYVSATGASSVRGLAPMPRLGLWGTAAAPFADFKVTLPLTPPLPLPLPLTLSRWPCGLTLARTRTKPEPYP